MLPLPSPVASPVRHLEAGDRPVGAVAEAGDGGAEGDRQVLPFGEGLGVELVDAGLVRPALERVAAERRIGGHAGHGGGEDRLPCPERGERRGEVRREVALADRPGGVEAEPGAGAEVDGVEGHAAPGPEVRGAAEAAGDGGVRLEMVVGVEALGDARGPSAAGSGPAPPLSSTSTRKPRSASASAVTMPTGPEPMTVTSAASSRSAARRGWPRIMRAGRPRCGGPGFRPGRGRARARGRPIPPPRACRCAAPGAGSGGGSG